MSLTKEVKLEIVEKHGRGPADTGSAEVQVALLTTDQRPHRASADASQGSLLAARAPEARRPASAIPQLPGKDIEGYRALIQELGLRR